MVFQRWVYWDVQIYHRPVKILIMHGQRMRIHKKEDVSLLQVKVVDVINYHYILINQQLKRFMSQIIPKWNYPKHAFVSVRLKKNIQPLSPHGTCLFFLKTNHIFIRMTYNPFSS